MTASPSNDVPEHAYVAAGLATKILSEFVARGGSAGDLFTAFVGLVSAHDKVLGGQCLLALEEATTAKLSDRPTS